MKNLLTTLLAFAFCLSGVTAQVITKAVRDVQTAQLTAGLTYDIMDIEVFERPNYGGKSGRFKMENGKFTSPFKYLNKVSFKVPSGKIVYIKNCRDEFATEAAYTTSQSSANLTGICGIRSDEKATIGISFNGISTIIHNNDCKRFFGSIRIKAFESSPDGSGAIAFMPYTLTSHRADAFTYLAYSNTNANTIPTAFARRDYVFNANPVPVLTENLTWGNFDIGRNALRDGRVSFTATIDLGSAHKTCDLCDDFSSNVRMAAPVTETFPLNKLYSNNRIVNTANSRVVLGPYNARGSRDGSAITASAGTLIDFKVHLTVAGL